MFRDVSDVERAQSEVRKNEKLLRTLIDHSVNGILRLRWVQDEGDDFRKLRCIFANAMAGKFLNADREDLVDCTGAQIVRIASNAMDPDVANTIVENFRACTEAGDSVDVEVHHQTGGTARWLRMIVEPFGTDIALTLVDITDGKAKEQHMESMALSDPLTGVLNRRGFERDASQRLTDSADDATGALLFIDLDHFEAGDEAGRGARVGLAALGLHAEPVGALVDADGCPLDSDGDGLAAWMEYVAGTDPEQADALTGAILDWRDTDSDAQVNGAEDPDYRAAGMLYGAKDQPFSSVEELRQVLGMTPELYRTLAPALTVYSRRSKVNPIFAPRLVLLAVLELPEAQIDEYLDAKAEGESDSGELLPPGAGSQLVQQGGDTVHRIHVEVPVCEDQPFALEAVVRVSRGNFQILAWELSLPMSGRAPQGNGTES